MAKGKVYLHIRSSLNIIYGFFQYPNLRDIYKSLSWTKDLWNPYDTLSLKSDLHCSSGEGQNVTS